jgi:hypothetical protein
LTLVHALRPATLASFMHSSMELCLSYPICMCCIILLIQLYARNTSYKCQISSPSLWDARTNTQTLTHSHIHTCNTPNRTGSTITPKSRFPPHWTAAHTTLQCYKPTPPGAPILIPQLAQRSVLPLTLPETSSCLIRDCRLRASPFWFLKCLYSVSDTLSSNLAYVWKQNVIFFWFSAFRSAWH